MKMDLKGLCKQLGKATEEKVVSTEGGNEYLLEQVLRPMMQSKKLFLKDIDFSKFDVEDVRWLTAYYESLEMQGRKLAQLVGVIDGIEPAACKVRSFC